MFFCSDTGTLRPPWAVLSTLVTCSFSPAVYMRCDGEEQKGASEASAGGVVSYSAMQLSIQSSLRSSSPWLFVQSHLLSGSFPRFTERTQQVPRVVLERVGRAERFYVNSEEEVSEGHRDGLSCAAVDAADGLAEGTGLEGRAEELHDGGPTVTLVTGRVLAGTWGEERSDERDSC